MDNDFGDQASAESFANFAETELSVCLNQLFEAKLFDGEDQMLEFVIGKARESWDQRLVNSALTITDIAMVGNELQASKTTEEEYRVRHFKPPTGEDNEHRN
jgi:hypothetical protein